MKNEYEIRGDVTAIFLKRKDGTVYETFISTSDLDKVQSFPGRWFVSNETLSTYVTGHTPTRKGRTVKLHRWIFDEPVGIQVDHIDGNTLDNRQSNLRTVTKSQNAQNRVRLPANNTSGYRNVCWNKRKQKWMVTMAVKGKQHFIGYFDDVEEANKSAIEARAKHMPFSKEGSQNVLCSGE